MSDIDLASWSTAVEIQVDLEPPATMDGSICGFAGVPDGVHRVSANIDHLWRSAWIHVTSPCDGKNRVILGPGSGPGDGPSSTQRRARFPSTRLDLWRSLTINLAHCLSDDVHRAPMRQSDAAIYSDVVRQPDAGRRPDAGHRLSSVASLVLAYRSPTHVLAEMEQAFLDGFYLPPTGSAPALARWRRIISLICASTPGDIENLPGLYSEAAQVISAELQLIGSDVLDDSLVYELDFLCFELDASKVPGVGNAGEVLRECFASGPRPQASPSVEKKG